jgi:hypothetical protein
MASRLTVTDLDFDTIKTNLKTFLQQQSEFTDYDFEGAGLNVLLDILAYNTHYNAYYMNMIANESFMDTAQLRRSVISHAKTLGYTSKSVSAAKAVINATVDTFDSSSGQLTIPRGYTFRSNVIDNKFYNFLVLEDVTVTKAETKYFFENLDIYEGELVTFSFTQNNLTNPKQVFVLPSNAIDTTSVKVIVTDNLGNTATTVYTKVTNALQIDSTSEVYFINENLEGNYQINFGDGVLGKQIPDGATVTVSYLITNADVANFVNNFSISSAIGGFSSVTIDVIEVAAGGAPKETVDSIKFNSTSQFATQNRLITYKDYETYILQNYSKIDSISVWGGEENDPPVYGKVFISMKPKTDYFISNTEKQRIVDDIIKPVSIVAVLAEIVDPEYLYVLTNVDVQYDKTKTVSTSDAIKTAIRNAIISYKNTNLNKFGAKLVNSKMEKAIDNVDLNSIIGSDSTFRLEKRFEPVLNTVRTYSIKFNVPLHRGTITNKLTSTLFNVIDTTGVIRQVQFEEIPQSYSGISSIKVKNPGYEYLTAPTVTITGDGFGATAEAIIVNGKIESINVLNRGTDYTRAIVTITGGSGYGGEATVEIDSRVGSLRTIYFDTNAEKQIVDSNAGIVNYDTGEIIISDINILSLASSDGLIRLNIESQNGIIESVRNTIITIDETDPSSIVVNLSEV